MHHDRIGLHRLRILMFDHHRLWRGGLRCRLHYNDFVGVGAGSHQQGGRAEGDHRDPGR
jgi:hypothetical protein